MSNVFIPASIRDKAIRDTLIAIVRELTNSNEVEVQSNPPNYNDPGNQGDIVYATSDSSIWVFTGNAWTPSAIGQTSQTYFAYADTADGSIILTLGSTVNGLCNQVTDFMVLTIDNAIVVDADVSQTTCANNPNAVLNGAVSGGTTNTGVWTSDGGGSFNPIGTTLNATYVPNAADTTDGLIVLTLTSTNNGTCLAVSDVINLTITDAPFINTITNQTVCANNPNVSITATDNGVATGYQWSTSGDGTFDTPTALGATYTPSAADTAAGVTEEFHNLREQFEVVNVQAKRIYNSVLIIFIAQLLLELSLLGLPL